MDQPGGAGHGVRVGKGVSVGVSVGTGDGVNVGSPGFKVGSGVGEFSTVGV